MPARPKLLAHRAAERHVVVFGIAQVGITVGEGGNQQIEGAHQRDECAPELKKYARWDTEASSERLNLTQIQVALPPQYFRHNALGSDFWKV